MTVRRDSADHPSTQESIAKLGNMVNTIKVTNRINKTRARRVGVIGRPGSLALPDNQFISQLNEGLPSQRVVPPAVGGENQVIEAEDGVIGDCSGGGEEGADYSSSSFSYNSPVSVSSNSQVKLEF